MTVLRPHLPFSPEETSISFANRLALLHTGCGLRQLLRDIGIALAGFLSGHAEETIALAVAAGIQPDALLANTVDVRRTHALFRGEWLSRAFLSPRAARYCPACLAEDRDSAAWRHQLIWGLRHVYRCDRHGLWLNASPDPSAETLHGVIPTKDLSDRRAVAGDVPGYLIWLRTRLGGDLPQSDGWLNGQTLEQVLNASEMIGAILEHGHDVRVARLSPRESEDATDIGFSIYKEGPDAVTDALDTIRAKSPASAVQAGPLACYGQMFDWLDRRCNAIDPGPLRDILRDHIVRHSAVAPGRVVLGQEVIARKAHTLQSLSEELAMDRRRLSRLLQKLGMVPQGATDRESGNLVFDADETLELIKAFRTAVHLHDLPEYLGSSKRQVLVLYRAGILKPLIPATGRGSVRNVMFARRHLDEILGKIERLPELPPKIRTVT